MSVNPKWLAANRLNDLRERLGGLKEAARQLQATLAEPFSEPFASFMDSVSSVVEHQNEAIELCEQLIALIQGAKFSQFEQISAPINKAKQKPRTESSGVRFPQHGPDYTYENWVNHLAAHGYRCRYCGKPITEKTARKDHVQPISRGGLDTLSNIVPACDPCNTKKGNMNGVEFEASRQAGFNRPAQRSTGDSLLEPERGGGGARLYLDDSLPTPSPAWKTPK